MLWIVASGNQNESKYLSQGSLSPTPVNILRVQDGAPECHTQSTYSHQAPQQEQGARVRLCNYVKFKVGENLLPAMKIVTHIVQ